MSDPVLVNGYKIPHLDQSLVSLADVIDFHLGRACRQANSKLERIHSWGFGERYFIFEPGL